MRILCDGEVVRLHVADSDDDEFDELQQTAFFIGNFRNRNSHRHIVERMFSTCESTMQRFVEADRKSEMALVHKRCRSLFASAIIDVGAKYSRMFH